MNHMLAVCDSEAAYGCRLVDFFSNKKGFPFQVQLFTSLETLEEFVLHQPLSVALISERDYKPEIISFGIPHLILLGEGEGAAENGIKSLYKYQSAEQLTKELLSWIADEGVLGRAASKGSGLKMIGIYSPVGKCLKTSFSFVLGQLLGKKHKVLYLNMESYSGLGRLLKKEFSTDLSELIYHLQNSREKFMYRMGSMIEPVNGLDVLPPFGSYLDFISVTGEEWIQFFHEIETGSDYEYLILDLSDAVRGLFDILRLCDVVYTLSREDGFAMAKVSQYEEVLRKSNYEDIWKKTRHYTFPQIKNLPTDLQSLTYTELAEYAKECLQEDFYER